jgi:lysophospholipase L1-like esterase
MVGKASYFVDRTAPGAPETPTLVLAYYWGNRLIGAAYSTQTVENGQNGYITAQNLIPVGASAVKAFVWNSFGELIPVAAPSVRSVPAGPDGPPKNVQDLISPSDSNIKYFGRWVDIGEKKLSNWGGAYFKTDFTGTTVKIKLSAKVKLAVKIDDLDDVYYYSAEGIVNLTPEPLADGRHSLRVATQYQNDVMLFEGLLLDGGAALAEPQYYGNIIEFIGDSLTSGYKLDPTELYGVALTDYAWLAAEALNYEHTQIAQTGICLTDGVDNKVGMSVKYFKTGIDDTAASPDWDFSKYQPEFVVINLGSNDLSKGITSENYQAEYETFIENIRAKYPNAYILALRPFKGHHETAISAAVTARKNAGENKLEYIDTSGWTATEDYFPDNIHPTEAGHQKIAVSLQAVIDSLDD